ncbi:hypothetical protein JKP88DRAFT_214446 [Tribonema minus]|uniref:Uncharacterized protein n=1 Tax=Tribonema minus TaxID=303371 RepID=A0A836CNK7_9STRA|nr:hypothetical protein JKP88DRAFT_214446 [Tribonema minus]
MRALAAVAAIGVASLAPEGYAFVTQSAVLAAAPRYQRQQQSCRLHMASKGFGGGKASGAGGEPVTSAGRGLKVMEEQMRQFQRIKDAGGVITDLYARAPGDPKFFFTGKIATGTVTVEQAVHLHKALAAEYIRMLVPDLPERLQFFVAPGGTEVAVAKNEIGLKRMLADGAPDLSTVTSLREVGFMPEPYGPGETVYYTRKADDGSCLEPPAQVTIAPMPPSGVEGLGLQ